MTRKLPHTNIPYRYAPYTLSKRDQTRQRKEIKKSRKLYKKGIYYSRKTMKSYKHIKSPHVRNAMRMYDVPNVKPTPELARKTKCSLKTLKKIVNKGRGAYFSSGSRPNQTAESWGIARLASAITGRNAAKVDYHLLSEGCQKKSRALQLADQLLEKE
jgi:hypothetical protein